MHRWIAVLTVAFVLFGAEPLWAWGPATHTKLATDILANLSLLPSAIASILAAWRRDYIFGNIAADVVFAKRLSRAKQFCHRWATAFRLLDDTTNDRQKAFVYGYLSHLAADTVAHNKFLPRQMTVTQTTMSFGHLYWELRADSAIGTHYWHVLRDILAGQRFPEHEMVLARRLVDTLLPFDWNLHLFYSINYLISRRGVIRAIELLGYRSRWELSDEMLANYRDEAADRILDVLTNGPRSHVVLDDPNGTNALLFTRVQRRQHRRMARVGILGPHVLREATAAHEPKPKNNGRDTNNAPHQT